MYVHVYNMFDLLFILFCPVGWPAGRDWLLQAVTPIQAHSFNRHQLFGALDLPFPAGFPAGLRAGAAGGASSCVRAGSASGVAAASAAGAEAAAASAAGAAAAAASSPASSTSWNRRFTLLALVQQIAP